VQQDEVAISASTGVFKRCSCRDEEGKPLNARCPRLRERGHGSWYFRVEMPRSHDGRRRQLRRGGFSSRQAAQRARDYLRNPATNEPSPLTVSTAQWLQLWLDTRLGLARSTLRCYSHHVRDYLIPYLGGTLLRELTQARVQAMFTALIRTHGAAGRPLRAGTLQRIHATLRAALNAAVRRGRLLDRKPARYVELPLGRRPHAVVWTPPRIGQWRATGEHPRVAVWMAQRTATFLRGSVSTGCTRCSTSSRCSDSDARSRGFAGVISTSTPAT
jgi:hypothetical protein